MPAAHKTISFQQEKFYKTSLPPKNFTLIKELRKDERNFQRTRCNKLIDIPLVAYYLGVNDRSKPIIKFRENFFDQNLLKTQTKFPKHSLLKQSSIGKNSGITLVSVVTINQTILQLSETTQLDEEQVLTDLLDRLMPIENLFTFEMAMKLS
ncbi:hypothetical protein BpHYR1_047143 [Brachionus plicatilis]|uniref:Uncharacterized protein n=1 Tax=Brachionus plicatilis TaxID=10195 RepID=A0A3M7Q573_BRAPC|nr:hypothetical protein BpHYR1_047143 [Brachionus plicatilis]